MNLVMIQARMGSTRLPGKVLKTLSGKSQLQQMVERLRLCRSEVDLMLVTSDLPQDDVLAEAAAGLSLPVFRGSEWDVLSRFADAARSLNLSDADVVVRVTADCPLHHGEVLDFALEQHKAHTLDYFTNSFAPHYEDGFDTEVLTARLLFEAAEQATLLSQREHVTPFLKDSGHYLCGYRKFIPEYRCKLSVDTPADFALAEAIFSRFPNNTFGMKDVLRLLESEPELLHLNAESAINAGYAKSLENDRVLTP